MPVNKMLIETYLKKLRMPQVAKTYESLAREAADNNLDYEEYLLCLLEQEILFFAREISSLLQKFFPRHRWGNFMSTPATLAAKSHMFSADSRSLLL